MASDTSNDQRPKRTSWLPDCQQLCQLAVGCNEASTLQTLASKFLSIISSDVESCLSHKKGPRATGRLCSLLKSFLIHLHMKPSYLKAFKGPHYEDVVAALLSYYIDLSFEISSANASVAFLSNIVTVVNLTLGQSPLHVVETLLQLKKHPSGKWDELYPLLKRVLINPTAITCTPVGFLKTIVLIKQWMSYGSPKHLRRIRKLGLRLVPPAALGEWLASHGFKHLRSGLEDPSTSVGEFLLSEQLTAKSCSRLLDMVCNTEDVISREASVPSVAHAPKGSDPSPCFFVLDTQPDRQTLMENDVPTGDDNNCEQLYRALDSTIEAMDVETSWRFGLGEGDLDDDGELCPLQFHLENSIEQNGFDVTPPKKENGCNVPEEGRIDVGIEGKVVKKSPLSPRIIQSSDRSRRKSGLSLKSGDNSPEGLETVTSSSSPHKTRRENSKKVSTRNGLAKLEDVARGLFSSKQHGRNRRISTVSFTSDETSLYEGVEVTSPAVGGSSGKRQSGSSNRGDALPESAAQTPSSRRRKSKDTDGHKLNHLDGNSPKLTALSPSLKRQKSNGSDCIVVQRKSPAQSPSPQRQKSNSIKPLHRSPAHSSPSSRRTSSGSDVLDVPIDSLAQKHRVRNSHNFVDSNQKVNEKGLKKSSGSGSLDSSPKSPARSPLSPTRKSKGFNDSIKKLRRKNGDLECKSSVGYSPAHGRRNKSESPRLLIKSPVVSQKSRGIYDASQKLRGSSDSLSQDSVAHIPSPPRQKSSESSSVVEVDAQISTPRRRKSKDSDIVRQKSNRRAGLPLPSTSSFSSSSSRRKSNGSDSIQSPLLQKHKSKGVVATLQQSNRRSGDSLQKSEVRLRRTQESDNGQMREADNASPVYKTSLRREKADDTRTHLVALSDGGIKSESVTPPRRGRPKKSDPNTSPAKHNERLSESASLTLRRRGRPKKSDHNTSPAKHNERMSESESLTLRRRGRPKKSNHNTSPAKHNERLSESESLTLRDRGHRMKSDSYSSPVKHCNRYIHSDSTTTSGLESSRKSYLTVSSKPIASKKPAAQKRLRRSLPLASDSSNKAVKRSGSLVLRMAKKLKQALSSSDSSEFIVSGSTTSVTKKRRSWASETSLFGQSNSPVIRTLRQDGSVTSPTSKKKLRSLSSDSFRETSRLKQVSPVPNLDHTPQRKGTANSSNKLKKTTPTPESKGGRKSLDLDHASKKRLGTGRRKSTNDSSPSSKDQSKTPKGSSMKTPKVPSGEMDHRQMDSDDSELDSPGHSENTPPVCNSYLRPDGEENLQMDANDETRQSILGTPDPRRRSKVKATKAKTVSPKIISNFGLRQKYRLRSRRELKC